MSSVNMELTQRDYAYCQMLHQNPNDFGQMMV